MCYCGSGTKQYSTGRGSHLQFCSLPLFHLSTGPYSWQHCAAGDGNVNGYGLEFFLETPADELPDNAEDVARSWQFQLLYTVSQLAAGAPSRPPCRA